jgi:Trypsin-like peptidase domain/Effector-associated domain 1
MPLTREQFEELTLALVAAFPRQGDLDIMVKFKLGAYLNTITAENNPYKLQVFQLVQWSDAQDRVDDLLAGALNLNERNKALRSIARKLQLDEGAGDFESIVLARVPIADVDLWRTRMMTTERAVCRVEIPASGGDNIGIGTGFLVGGSVAITNKHVIEAITWAGSTPADIVLRFDYKMKGQTEIQKGVTYRLDSARPILETSEVAALDFALLNVDGSPAQGSVAGQPGAPARGWLKPVAYQFQINDPIFIVQHPKASPLKFAPGSVNDLSPTVNRVGYTTNTENGSSGSPCCTADWKVVALHHWGGPSHNRGVRFSAILDYLAPKHLSGFLTD